MSGNFGGWSVTPLQVPDFGATFARAQQMQANRLAMMAQRQEMDQRNALTAALQQNASALGGSDPQGRTNALTAILGAGPQGAALALPVLNQERENAMIAAALRGATVPMPPAAAPSGAPPSGSYTDRMVQMESGGDQTARNPRSTATGAGQFIDSTWLQFAEANPALFQGMSRDQVLAARNNPGLSRRAVEWYRQHNLAALQQAGLPANDGTAALAHRFGPQGAAALLRADPTAPVAGVVGEQVMAANPDLAGRTVGQVTGMYAQRFGGAGAPSAAGGSGNPYQRQIDALVATGNLRALQIAQSLSQIGARGVPELERIRLPGGQEVLVPRAQAAGMVSAPQTGERTQLLGEYQALVDRGENLTAGERARRDALASYLAGNNVNVRLEQGPQVGTIPPGHQLERMPDGTLRMTQIPGSPAQRAEQQRRDSTARTGNAVVQDIDRVFSLLDQASLPVTGFGASTLGRVPGTGAADAARLLDGIRANVGFERLNQMRQESPTGGALGAVTERELALLQSVMGSLDQTQSPQQFRDNLARVRNTFLDIVHGPGHGPRRMRLSYETDDVAPVPEVPGPGGSGVATPPPAAGEPRRLRYNPRTNRIE